MLDECDSTEAEESRVVQQVVLPEELQAEESVQVPTRLTPDGNFLDERKKLQKIINTKTNYDDFSRYKSDGVLTGEVFPEADTPPNTKGQEYSELPISKVQIKEVIQAVENMETKMKDEMKRNATQPQYQVHEEVREMFVPEQPIREDDEYFFEAGQIPDSYFLPANQKPLTLQSVLRPTPHKPSNNIGNMRPPFRRPAPPEIKVRRPPPMYPKGNMGYPLPMPNHHGSHGPMKKPPPKFNQNRLQTNMNRPPMPGVPPMKSMPPLHHNNPKFNQLVPKQTMKMPNNGPVQSIIMGKPGPNNVQLTVPSQTLNLGQTDIIANQVVKSQITLPGGNDAIAQHSTIQTFLNKPGQIILGKPMDNPMPLDQQMIPTKQLGMRSPPTPAPFYQSTPSNIILKQESEQQSQNEIKSSDFIGESPDKSTIPPAVNTGFKPDSIVVESGFKPIIREPLMAGVDRIADYEIASNANRREDADVEEDYEESPQYISNNHQYPSDKMTETFEPMFIPSPPDHLLPTNDRTKEVFPKNHAKEDRPHPVYVKKASQQNSLFSKKNVDRDVPGDLLMESDRISPHYLPPDPNLPKEHSQKLSSSSADTFTTYDGKTVSAATLTSVPDGNKPSTKLFSAKLPANSEQLLKTPQFGPFKGEIPPLVDAHIDKDTKEVSTAVLDSRTTHLKLVNIQKPEDAKVGDLKADGSERIEVTEKMLQFGDIEEYDGLDEDSKMRARRDTKTTQFEMGEIEEVQTNGHSMPKNQVEFENEPHATAAATTIRLYWMTNILLLTLSVKLL